MDAFVSKLDDFVYYESQHAVVPVSVTLFYKA